MLFFLGSLSKSKWLTPFQGGSGVVRCSIHWPSSILTDVHREIRSVVHYLFQSNYCRCSLTLNHAGSFEQLGHVQALGISIPRYPKSLCVYCVCVCFCCGGVVRTCFLMIVLPRDAKSPLPGLLPEMTYKPLSS